MLARLPQVCRDKITLGSQWINTENMVRFHTNKFDVMLCIIYSTEYKRSFELKPAMNYNQFHTKNWSFLLVSLYVLSRSLSGLHQRKWSDDACATPQRRPRHELAWIWTDFLSEQRRATEGVGRDRAGRRAGGKRQPARCSRKTQDKFAIASMAKKLLHRCIIAHARVHMHFAESCMHSQVLLSTMHVQVCTLDRCCEHQRTHLLHARYRMCICAMYVHVYMHMYMCIYMCMHVYICICVYVYKYICIYMWMCICVYVYVYVYIYIYMYVYVCVYIYIYVSISHICAVCFI